MLVQNLIMTDIRSFGFASVRGRLFCDDPDLGSQMQGATYYMLVIPASDWRQLGLELYKVGNRVPLRKATVAIRPDSVRMGVRTLMNRQGWAVAFAPHEGC